MSVREADRNPSRVEFLKNFHELRRDVEMLLMRDFGLKTRKYEIALMEEIYNLSEEDRKLYESLLEKVGAKSVLVDKYPAWLIENWRNSIMGILDEMGKQIELANSVYVVTQEEFVTRRLAWDRAIGSCNALRDKLHDIVFCVKTDVTLGCYKVISEKLAKEINLLKAVRKSDNKRKGSSL